MYNTYTYPWKTQFDWCFKAQSVVGSILIFSGSKIPSQADLSAAATHVGRLRGWNLRLEAFVATDVNMNIIKPLKKIEENDLTHKKEGNLSPLKGKQVCIFVWKSGLIPIPICAHFSKNIGRYPLVN